MKNRFSLTALTLISVLVFSCKQESGNSNMSANDVVLAELVESKTILVKPEGWDDEYWNSVNKNVDREKIFNIIVNAVLSGKQKAYNILTDQQLTTEEVKQLLENVQVTNSGVEAMKIGPEDISTIRMREKWIFNEKEFKLKKQVTRIDLLLQKLDDNGVNVGDKALFYVNLNN